MIDCTTKQFLGQLRQFSFILTGDETAADAAVAETLTSARGHMAEADAFPCHRSWLFANLFRVLNDYSSWSMAINSISRLRRKSSGPVLRPLKRR